jgi:hypothetical protein
MMKNNPVQTFLTSLYGGAFLFAAAEEATSTEEEVIEEKTTEEEDGLFQLSDEDIESLSPDQIASQLENNKEEEQQEEQQEEQPVEDQENPHQKQEPEQEQEQTVDQEQEENLDDAQVQLQNLFAPLRASKQTVQIRDIDHARALMQMGVDYNKKMQGLKPYVPFVKALQKEGFDDPEKFNLLLAAGKGDVNALKRIIADNEIDLLDIADEEEVEEAKNYQPNNFIPDPKQVEIEEVLETIKDSPSYNDTITLLTEVFDEKSRVRVADDPNIVALMNKDVESGVANKILEEMEYRQTVNRRPYGLSDLDWYIQIAQEFSAQQQPQQPQQVQQQNQMQQPDNNSNAGRNKRRQSMGGVQGQSRSASSVPKSEYDILSLSDEEIEKLAQNLGV